MKHKPLTFLISVLVIFFITPVITIVTGSDTNIYLDESLISKSSTTTRIDQMTKEELSSIENLIFEVVGKNKVQFKNTLYFSSDKTTIL